MRSNGWNKSYPLVVFKIGAISNPQWIDVRISKVVDSSFSVYMVLMKATNLQHQHITFRSLFVSIQYFQITCRT